MDFELSERRRSGGEGYRRSSSTKCCRATATGSNMPRLAAKRLPVMGELQAKVPGGLWNLGFAGTRARRTGTRLSNLEYAPLAEITGRLFWAPEVFNCQAPDVPNMIGLQNCADAAQRKIGYAHCSMPRPARPSA